MGPTFLIVNSSSLYVFYIYNNDVKATNFFKNQINEKNVKYFTIPFVPFISEQFKNIVKHLDVKLSYFSLNKLHQFIKCA